MEAGLNLDAYTLSILGIDDGEAERLRRAVGAGLIDLSPVVLPEYPTDDNNHLGWPVATRAHDTLVVVHRRIPGHNPHGAGSGDARSTFSMVTTSSDGGKSWTRSCDLRDFMVEEYRHRGGILPLSHRYKFGPVNESREGYKLHLNAIGSTRTGRVVVLCNYGAFVSDDRGASFRHIPGAFREDTFDGDIVYLGPRIVDHPELGLLAFGNTVTYGLNERFPNPVPGPVDPKHHSLVLLSSKDCGETWRKRTFKLPDWAAPHEPAATVHEGRVLIIGRDQQTGTDHLAMSLVGLDDGVSTARTNMRNSRYIDTVDLDYNPVTGRLEVVRSKREAMRVDLYSIDPEEWGSAEWRYEGSLLQRQGSFYKTADGFHPAGAVIDAEAGVQHLFIYTGHPNGPAGSFRLTRTLDTPALRRVLARA